jgi:dipeptidyl-peptidase-4
MKNIIAVTLVFIAIQLNAQQKITVADFTTKNTFAAKTVTGINWMNDGQFYSTLKDNRIVKYNITTGEQVEILLDGNTLSPKVEIDDYSITPDEQKLVFSTETQSIYRRSFVAEYYILDLSTKVVRKLSGGGKQSYATISPDGKAVAFVRDNNLFYTTLADMQEVKVTDDGKLNSIINGTTDWVYEEEFAFVKGFFWSPDSKKLAFYRFDETIVREYNMQMWGKALYPADYKFKYPKAGEKNASLGIYIFDIQSKSKIKADLGNEAEFYIPRIKWTEDPNILSIRKMNRLQNQLEILHVNAATGKSTLILKEVSDTYIDVRFIDDLIYLKDQKHFITPSESAGYIHLYLYTIDGRLVRPITKGNFEVSDFLGIDEATKTLYYTSTEVSPQEKHFYSISWRGDKKQRLSRESGTHLINMSTDYRYYIDQYSTSVQPPVSTLYQTKGNKKVKDLETNQELVDVANNYGLAEKAFFRIKSAGADSITGYMLRPANFTKDKKYPVLVYQYSGPGSQYTANSWAGNHFYFHQLLTQHGYIVVAVDPRGTGAHGEKFKKDTYKQLGKLELEDVLETASYLSTLSYVDAKRLGIWGWSYGGYVSALALTKGAGAYKLGMAVSPITNWRFYNTIYTERYLRTPQENPTGYDDNSPLTYANQLQGNLLLIHGTGDDNVHLQNSIQFQEALIQAGKQFDSFFYPDKNHSIPGAKHRHHLYTQMFKFVLENL